MSTAFLSELEERFLRYVQIDTTADPTSPTSPSTQIQYDLLNLLADPGIQLVELGRRDLPRLHGDGPR